jgi:peptidyl-prolyl cis-trans isomerase SurA
MLCFFIYFSFLFCQQELVDGVVATVGDKTVLFSEVLSETRMLAEQKKISPQESPLLFQRLFDAILKDKIYLKVVLIEAEKDSLFSVTYEEINSSLNERIEVFTSQVGSKENLEKAFGMSLGDIKNNYWETVREEILIEKFKYSLLADVTVSKNDVFSFYEEYQDSIPSYLDKASFSLVEKKISVSKQSENNIKERLEALKDSLNKNLLSFSETALLYSQDPSVSTNKGIMETTRGDLVPEYEKTAYSLLKNEIGGPIKTRFGYHLIKLLGKKGEKINSQHILLTLFPSGKDSLFSASFVDSLKIKTKNDPGLFDSLAVSLKTDPNNFSGFYKEIETESFPFVVQNFLKKGNNYSFSPVLYEKGSFYYAYKYSYVESEKRTPQNSWVFLENLSINKKRGDVFEMWIQEKIEDTYVKINNSF